MGIFLSSDYHLNHNKDFIYKARGFECVEDMNEEIVKRHNEVVGWDDDIYIPENRTNGAMNRDIVSVSISKEKTGKRVEGSIVKSESNIARIKS